MQMASVSRVQWGLNLNGRLPMICSTASDTEDQIPTGTRKCGVPKFLAALTVVFLFFAMTGVNMNIVNGIFNTFLVEPLTCATARLIKTRFRSGIAWPATRCTHLWAVTAG
ncbi:MAG: hypothetical protein IPP88_13915 [Betaproteobacteria bacterium]|nr:hypothetical protein [Betaproteobacteria bacterium]